MLANAMDPNFSSNVRPEFIETVRQLQPLEVLIMQFAFKADQSSSRRFNVSSLPDALKTRPTAIELSIAHLAQLKCLSPHGDLGQLTTYGFELMLASAKDPASVKRK